MRAPTKKCLSAIALSLVACAAGCSSAPDHTPPPPDDPLHYEQTRWLDGLEQNVRLVKTSRTYLAYLDDGRVVPIPEMQRLDAEAARTKFGALAPRFARYVDGRPGEQPIAAAFFFTLDDADWPSLTRRLSAPDEATRLAAQADLKASIARARGPSEDILRAAGVDVKRTFDSIPVAFGFARPAVLKSVARHEKMHAIYGADTHRMEKHAGPKNGVSDPHIDTVWNSAGFFGAGQKIAHMEDTMAGLYDTHEAFSLAEQDLGGFGTLGSGYRVTYQVEPQDCVTSFDCGEGAACVTLGHAGHAGQCVTMHASQCMSVTTGTNGGTGFGAAKARYYYPNQPSGISGTNMCDPMGLVSAYDWLQMNGVTTVNESFGCQVIIDNGENLEGLVEDWYARMYSMSISKSAGNQKTGPFEPACPYTLNSTCVGATEIGGGAMSPWSSWTNDNAGGGNRIRTDREEPDLAAFGGDAGGGTDVDVLNCNEFTLTCGAGWTTSAGTSFSAPAVAALTALCKEAAGGSVPEKLMRAILKSGSWGRNVRDFNYSESSTIFLPNNDWHDGGGGILAEQIKQSCAGGTGGPGPGTTSGSDPGDLRGGSPYPYPPSDCQACNHNDPPFGGKSIKIASPTPFGPGDGRNYTKYFEVDLRGGDRLRTTLVWDSCPAGPTGTAPAPVATDIDIVVFHDGVPVYSSQSVSDVTEGFDITIPEGFDGHYEIWWTNPTGAMGCDGYGWEPFAWSTWWWT